MISLFPLSKTLLFALSQHLRPRFGAREPFVWLLAAQLALDSRWRSADTRGKQLRCNTQYLSFSRSVLVRCVMCLSNPLCHPLWLEAESTAVVQIWYQLQGRSVFPQEKRRSCLLAWHTVGLLTRSASVHVRATYACHQSKEEMIYDHDVTFQDTLTIIPLPRCRPFELEITTEWQTLI